ncbi:hypothetical protein [Nafulsella turpanensis]|uniref:hypothetical protein n=1 Tax=Nafulsella turpanensis TaxID=1265690 RepID=UPI001F3640D4|nr:hypothetical protein [Nafulsella turpanensis]
MDIQAEKLELIERLTRIQDVEIIRRIKEILSSQSGPVAGYDPNGNSISQSALLERAEASNRAIQEGRVSSIEDLEKESENW